MTTRTVLVLMGVFAAVVLMAACGDDATPAAETSLPATTLDHVIVEASEGVIVGSQPFDPTGRVTGDAPASIVDEFVQRVSAETGLDVTAISVDVAIAKVWTDGSLGCAEPGLVYTQQEEAGYQVELSAGERSWSFRIRDDRESITCDD